MCISPFLFVYLAAGPHPSLSHSQILAHGAELAAAGKASPSDLVGLLGAAGQLGFSGQQEPGAEQWPGGQMQWEARPLLSLLETALSMRSIMPSEQLCTLVGGKLKHWGVLGVLCRKRGTACIGFDQCGIRIMLVRCYLRLV